MKQVQVWQDVSMFAGCLVAVEDLVDKECGKKKLHYALVDEHVTQWSGGESGHGISMLLAPASHALVTSELEKVKIAMRAITHEEARDLLKRADEIKFEYHQLDKEKIRKQLETAAEAYCVLGNIDEGVYGKVYKAKRGDRLFAIKRYKMDRFQTALEMMYTEASLLHLVRHPNVITFYEVQSNDIVMEYMETDLHARLDLSPVLPPQVIQSYMKQLLSGLAHCHQHTVLHRDLKPANLLITGDVIKLADFSISRCHPGDDSPLTAEMSPIQCAAPEILLGSIHYTSAVDIWSLGCVFAQMLQGNTKIFNEESQILQLYAIFRVLGTPTTEVWPDIKKDCPEYKESFTMFQGKKCILDNVDNVAALDLLQRMLTYDPRQRITARQALEHEYFCDAPLKNRKRKSVCQNLSHTLKRACKCQ